MLRSRLSLLSGSMLPLKRQYRRMEGEHISSHDALISEVYLPHVRLRKRSWTVNERIARQHLSPAFGNREPASLDRRDVELWLRSLSARVLAPSTCNRIFAAFRSVCSRPIPPVRKCSKRDSLKKWITAGRGPLPSTCAVPDTGQQPAGCIFSLCPRTERHRADSLRTQDMVWCAFEPVVYLISSTSTPRQGKKLRSGNDAE